MRIGTTSQFIANNDSEEEMYKELFTSLVDRTIVEFDVDDIELIGMAVFVDCINLKKVRIRNLKRIYYNNSHSPRTLFQGCSNLEEVDFPALKIWPGYTSMFNDSSGLMKKVRVVNLPSLDSIPSAFAFQYLGNYSETSQIVVNLDSCTSIPANGFDRTGHLDIKVPKMDADTMIASSSFPYCSTSYKTTNRFFCKDNKMIAYDTDAGGWVIQTY